MKRITLSILALAGAAACGTSGGAGGGAPAPAAPARFTYSPSSVQYMLSSHLRVEQEFQGQVQANDFFMQYYVTSEVVDDAGVSRVTMTMDSVTVLEGAGATAADAESAAGVTFSGILTSEGNILDYQVSDTTSQLVRQLAERFRRFFPNVPAGGVVANQSWSDTSAVDVNSQGIELLVETTTTNDAGGWMDHAGVQALPVDAVADYSLSGGGMQGGTEITLDGTGVTHSTYYLGSNGAFMGGVSADTANMAAFVMAMGMSIPITQVRFDTLTVVH
jgi:hypothetical protein